MAKPLQFSLWQFYTQPLSFSPQPLPNTKYRKAPSYSCLIRSVLPYIFIYLKSGKQIFVLIRTHIIRIGKQNWAGLRVDLETCCLCPVLHLYHGLHFTVSLILTSVQSFFLSLLIISLCLLFGVCTWFLIKTHDRGTF